MGNAYSAVFRDQVNKMAAQIHVNVLAPEQSISSIIIVNEIVLSNLEGNL